jgi:hypothetical protein
VKQACPRRRASPATNAGRGGQAVLDRAAVAVDAPSPRRRGFSRHWGQALCGWRADSRHRCRHTGSVRSRDRLMDYEDTNDDPTARACVLVTKAPQGRAVAGAAFAALGMVVTATLAFSQSQPPTQGPAVGSTPAWFLQGSFPDPGGRTVVEPGGKVTIPTREGGPGRGRAAGAAPPAAAITAPSPPGSSPT